MRYGPIIIEQPPKNNNDPNVNIQPERIEIGIFDKISGCINLKNNTSFLKIIDYVLDSGNVNNILTQCYQDIKVQKQEVNELKNVIKLTNDDKLTKNVSQPNLKFSQLHPSLKIEPNTNNTVEPKNQQEFLDIEKPKTEEGLQPAEQKKVEIEQQDKEEKSLKSNYLASVEKLTKYISVQKLKKCSENLKSKKLLEPKSNIASTENEKSSLLKDNKDANLVFVEGEEMIYEGELINGLEHGYGRWVYSNGIVKFAGEFIEGLPNGEEIILRNISNVIVYKGGMVKGLKNGFGKKFSDKGQLIYSGYFLEEMFHGPSSKLYNKDGILQYAGSFEKNLKHGNGVLYHNNGVLCYKGNFVDGFPESEDCELFHPTRGICYKGQILNGKKEGIGCLYSESGVLTYSGMFINDYPEGKNQMLYDDKGNQYYKGDLKKGKKEGKGILYNNNGQIWYSGYWKNDGPHGIGVELWNIEKNQEFRGTMLLGNKQGHGESFYKNGCLRYKGNFVDDKIEGKSVEIYYDCFDKIEDDSDDDYEQTQENILSLAKAPQPEQSEDQSKLSPFLQAFNKVTKQRNSLRANITKKTCEKKNLKVYYKGDMRKSLKHGKGVIYYRNGKIKYSGNFYDDKIHNSKATIFYKNSVIKFYGSIYKGVKHGRGYSYTIDKHLQYCGYYKRGRPDTKEAIIYNEKNNEIEYIGEIKKGKYHNLGELYHSKGNLEYDGYFLKGKMHWDWCSIYNSDDDCEYKGSMCFGQKVGFGKDYWPKSEGGGPKYSGWFSNGIKQDKNGYLYDKKGNVIYQGMIFEGFPEGFGTKYYSYPQANVKKIEGWFVKGEPDGLEMVEYNDKGKLKYLGEMVEGKKEGYGEIYDENGDMIYEGYFTNDNYLFAPENRDKVKKIPEALSEAGSTKNKKIGEVQFEEQSSDITPCSYKSDYKSIYRSDQKSIDDKMDRIQESGRKIVKKIEDAKEKFYIDHKKSFNSDQIKSICQQVLDQPQSQQKTPPVSSNVSQLPDKENNKQDLSNEKVLKKEPVNDCTPTKKIGSSGIASSGSFENCYGQVVYIGDIYKNRREGYGKEFVYQTCLNCLKFDEKKTQVYEGNWKRGRKSGYGSSYFIQKICKKCELLSQNKELYEQANIEKTHKSKILRKDCSNKSIISIVSTNRKNMLRDRSRIKLFDKFIKENNNTSRVNLDNDQLHTLQNNAEKWLEDNSGQHQAEKTKIQQNSSNEKTKTTKFNLTLNNTNYNVNNMEYEGNWKLNKKEGEGVLYYRNGNIKAKGYLKNNVLFSGENVSQYNKQGQIDYKGVMANSIRVQGYGTQYHNRNYEARQKFAVKKYQGRFVNGEIYGEEAVYYDELGNIEFIGAVCYGKEVGTGEIYWDNGELFYQGVQKKASDGNFIGDCYDKEGSVCLTGKAG